MGEIIMGREGANARLAFAIHMQINTICKSRMYICLKDQILMPDHHTSSQAD